MIDMFVDKMCNYCLNNNCPEKNKVEITKHKDCIIYKCNGYVKNKSKIIAYKNPLIVTAERDYVSKKEI